MNIDQEAFAMTTKRLATILVLTWIAGCGGGPRNDDRSCDPTAPACGEGLVCAEVLDGDPRCVGPVLIRGRVLDLATDEAIAGALVQAVDVNGAAVGTSAATDEEGAFTLTVPVVRDAEDAPADGAFTLRVQAAAYQEFPTAIRPALPLDATTATAEENGWVIDNPLTTVKLIPLPGDSANWGSISGTISAEWNAGVLVVAEGAEGAFTGFSDGEGRYTIFNVPAGAYTVRAYAAGLQVDAAATSLEVGEVDGVDLTESDRPLSTVSGNVQIVNAPGGSRTSIVLALESTFVEASGRGTVPPGLRVGDIEGAFTIDDVPDGSYVVLAAFENDALVRDPDQTIGGTEIVRITVPDPGAGNVVTLPEGFKVTGALAVVSPGADAPEEINTPTPTLTWEDDSSEEGYEIRVFDAFGNEVWSDEIGPTSGSATVSHVYAGPALEHGMFYQFRITSFREREEERTAISMTEDLKGVFYFLQ
jgi:hypothetical protein